MSVDIAYFDRLYGESADPWGFSSRWYEWRKRALVMATLPRQRFARAFEPGCSTGQLTTLLSLRCDVLLASDAQRDAVEHARLATQTLANVEIRQQAIPGDWPDGSFDLIVISELAYYLDVAELDHLVRRLRDSLRRDGCLVLCHWRPRVAGYPQTGDAVHARVADAVDLFHYAHHAEPDFVLDAWSADAASVAEHEGLR